MERIFKQKIFVFTFLTNYISKTLSRSFIMVDVLRLNAGTQRQKFNFYERFDFEAPFLDDSKDS